MSQRGDSNRSMRKRVTIDDATAEAALSGRPLGRNELADELAGVVGVMAEIRALGDRAGPVPTPSAELARLFVEGDASPVQSGAGAGHLAMGGAGLRRLAVRTRVVIASLASLGVIGVAGAAGALPAPAQHALARVVRTLTPFTIPDPVAAANDGTPVSPSSDGIRSDGSGAGSGSTGPTISTNTRVGRDTTAAPTSLVVVPEGSAAKVSTPGPADMTTASTSRLDADRITAKPTVVLTDPGDRTTRPRVDTTHREVTATLPADVPTTVQTGSGPTESLPVPAPEATSTASTKPDDGLVATTSTSAPAPTSPPSGPTTPVTSVKGNPSDTAPGRDNPSDTAPGRTKATKGNPSDTAPGRVK